MDRSEAIEIIRKNWPDGRVQLQEALLTLAPELKESEDERIKNFLIGKFREIGEVWHEYSTKDIIAWLEKKSMPQVRTGIEWEDAIDDACGKIYAMDYRHGEYCHEQSFKWGFQEGVEWLEKQGSQNLANSAKTCKDEQTPAWSEADERNINRVLHFLSGGGLIQGQRERLIVWLKSLKERYTWKPSDEQMIALKKACDEHWEPDGLDPLYTLYQDLKNLKG